MLINLSNHPSANWSRNQLAEGEKYGQVIDLPFPYVNPTFETFEIIDLVKSFEKQVMAMLINKNDELHAVHLMGELTFCFALIARLQNIGITCIGSTTKRIAIELPNGSKTSFFEFVRFREYDKILPPAKLP